MVGIPTQLVSQQPGLCEEAGTAPASPCSSRGTGGAALIRRTRGEGRVSKGGGPHHSMGVHFWLVCLRNGGPWFRWVFSSYQGHLCPKGQLCTRVWCVSLSFSRIRGLGKRHPTSGRVGQALYPFDIPLGEMAAEATMGCSPGTKRYVLPLPDKGSERRKKQWLWRKHIQEANLVGESSVQ